MPFSCGEWNLRQVPSSPAQKGIRASRPAQRPNFYGGSRLSNGPRRAGTERGRRMRVRRAPAFVAATVLALALGACGGGGNDTTSDTTVNKDVTFDAGTTMARLNKAGAVTVGTKFDQPLFGLKGLDGKPAGFDVEIAKIIAGELGIAPEKIRWLETPSKVREEKVEQGAVDYVVATYTINDKRRQRVTFAGPYYEAGQDLMVKKGNPKGIDGPQTLRAKQVKVCSVTGSTPGEKIKEYVAPNQLVLFDVYSKCA